MAQTIALGGMSARRRGGQVARFRQGVGVWMFLLPAVVFFVGYQVWPIVRVLWMSFTDYEFLTNQPGNWVWFDNYVQALPGGAADPGRDSQHPHLRAVEVDV